MASDTSGGTATAQPDLADRLRREQRSESTLNRIQHVLHANPILGPLAVLVVAIIAFAIVNGRFLSAANLGLVLQQVTVIATLALGQTLIILTAGIDLSAGAIAVFSSILMANMAAKLGVPGVLAIIIGLILGTAMGAINGLLVTRINLPPFIVTLATLSIFFSLNSVVSRSETIRGSDMPSIMTATGNNAFRIGGFQPHLGHDHHAACCSRSSCTRWAARHGASTSTPPATTSRPPGWRASAPTGCCCRCTSSRA